MKRAIALISLSLISACSLAPQMQVPVTVAPANFKEAAASDAGWIKATPASDQLGKDWWTQFSNPELNGLQVKAGSSNQTLQQALARLEEARAVVDVSSAGLLPSLGLNGNGGRSSSSGTVGNPHQRTTINDYLLSGNVAFEADLWGRVRNQVSADTSLAKASADDVATMELSIRSELAQQYFMLRGYDEMQRLLDETVISYDKALQLTQNRHAGGVATESDVTQAETQLNNAKTRAADTQLKRAQTEHGIAVLVGELPSNFSLPRTAVDSTLPEVTAGLPSTLLQRRPDVSAAVRRMEAANAEIGVAKAAYFPDLTLSAAGGFEGGAMKSLFEAPSLLWAFGAAATMPLFDGGKISGLTKQARARYDQNVASYRQTVLVSYQEVEDALAAIRQLAQESDTQQQAATAAEKTLDQIKKRYAGGVTNYLDVVVAQNTALDAEIQSINIHTERMIATVNLMKAFGGGWKN
ncbi:MAG: efflux transporter outer membrane subunit [Micavibrio sp.]|nr:efflux transporter outer membrane subunit [Micavibrio sp.]